MTITLVQKPRPAVAKTLEELTTENAELKKVIRDLMAAYLHYRPEANTESVAIRNARNVFLKWGAK